MPSADELARLYERYSYDHRGLTAVPQFVHPILEGVVRSFAPYRATNRLLDVGFGAGSLLKAAVAEGWATYGIETSALAVTQAREHGLGEVVHGDFLTAPFPNGWFDVIALDGVIEHLIDPVSFARRARELLTPSGLFYVTAPHGRGLSARWLGVAWSVWAPPEHLHLFSTRSIAVCLDRAGFSARSVNTRGVNPYELLRRVPSARQQPRGAPAAARFNRVDSSYQLNRRLMASPAGRGLKWLANAALDVARLGDSVVSYAVPNKLNMVPSPMPSREK